MSQIPLLSDEVCSFEEDVSLSTMDTEDRERSRACFEEVHVHLTSTTHPPGCDENWKRVICNKAKKFKLKDGELHVYHKQKQNRKVKKATAVVYLYTQVIQFSWWIHTLLQDKICVLLPFVPRRDLPSSS